VNYDADGEHLSHKIIRQPNLIISVYNNEWNISETNNVPTASTICEVKSEYSRLKQMKTFEESGRHTYLFVLVTSLLISGIQMKEMCRLG
jgi:hypothetical protein